MPIRVPLEKNIIKTISIIFHTCIFNTSHSTDDLIKGIIAANLYLP